MGDTQLADLISATDAERLDNLPGDIHAWFSLTYANYLVLPRTVLQSMPEDWQHRFVRCLRELEHVCAAAGVEMAPSYEVQARHEDGRFVHDPVPHYNRGRTRLDLTPQETDRG